MAATFDKELAKTLSDLEIPRRVKLSPDGAKVAYSTGLAWGHRAGKNNVSTIWLASAHEPGSSRKLTSGAFNDALPTWLPDGSAIVFRSDRAKPGESSGLWTLRLDGGDPTALTPTENAEGIGYFAVSPDGKSIAYSSADEKSEERKKEDEAGEPAPPEVYGKDLPYARLRVVDVASKEVKQLVGGDRHITRMSWSPDGTHLVFQSAENMEEDEPMLTGETISTVNVATGEVRDLHVFMNEVQNLTWAPDGKMYFMAGTQLRLMSCGKALYSIDPRESEPKPVRVVFGVDDDAIGLVVACGKLLAVSQSRFTVTIQEVNGSVIATQDTKVPAWDVYFDVQNGGQPVLAAALSDISSPYEVFTLKKDQERIQLSDHGKSLAGKSFGSGTVLTRQSSDGKEELDALYLAPSAKVGPDGKPTEPLPTFVIIHGGPADHDNKSFDSTYFNWPPYILSQGYGVLLPQYRGSSARGEKFAAYTQTGVGDFDYDDVISLTDHAVKSGFADAKRLIVGGWSQGGYLSYLCSARNGLHGLGWQFNATIAGAGVSDWDSLMLESDCGAASQTEMGGGRPPWMAGKDYIGGRKASAVWEVAHAMEESRRLGKAVIPPMLILHGRNDVRVPFSQAEGYRLALRAHNIPCEFVIYPGQGHVPSPQRYLLDMLERIGRWCHDYIGPGKNDE